MHHSPMCRDLDLTTPEYLAYLAILILVYDAHAFARKPCIPLSEIHMRTLMPREFVDYILRTLTSCNLIRAEDDCYSLTEEGRIVIERIRWGRGSQPRNRSS